MSVTTSGEPITRNRIREVCQLDSSVTDELRDFKVGLLANDLSSIGFLVPVMDKSGKSLSTNAICQRISEAIPPPVETMCMIGNKGSNKGIYKMVDMFNVNYGANIPIKNINGKSRPIEDLCDDLYLVADRVHRQLGSDVVNVKKALETHIIELKNERDMLTALFAKDVGSLHDGDRKDALVRQLKEIKYTQSGIVNHIDNELQTLNKELEGLTKEYDEYVDKSKTVLTKDLGDYAVLSALNVIPGLNANGTFDKVGKMIEIVKSSGAHTGHCTNCINKIFGSFAEYTAVRGSESYKQKLNEYIALKTRDAKTEKEVNELLSCVTALHSERCSVTDGTARASVLSRSDANQLLSSMSSMF